MSEQVEEVKTKNDIVTIIGERVELKKAGSKYKANCPFHSEKTPSFVVSPELQIYKCFGCQKSGDVITFLEEFEGMDFYEALKYLADRAGVKLTPLKGQEKGIRERLYEINSFISHFYHYVLTKHPTGKIALNYLTAERGLKLATIEKFQLGFSPDQPFALRRFMLEKKKVSINELEQIGIIYLRSGTPIDRFRGRVMFPLLDHRGNIAGFAGRTIPSVESKLPPERRMAKYINTPETLIYKKSTLLFGLSEVRQEIKAAGAAIIVEGELDMISSWQAGIKNAVAIKGSAFTEEQANLLSRFAKVIILALDADFAGNEAAKKAILKAGNEGIEVKVCDLGKYKDPDEIARKDPEEFIKRINDAISVWDFLVNSVFSKYKNITGAEKAKISKELAPIISSIEDKIVKAHYISLIAKRLQVPIEAVSEQMNIGQKTAIGKPRVFEQIAKKTLKTRSEILEERLLGVIFRYKPEELINPEIKGILNTPFAKKIAEEFERYPKNKKMEIPTFANSLPSELRERFSDLILKDIEGLENFDDENLLKEIAMIKKELEIYDLRQKLAELGLSIQDIEDSNQNEELEKKEGEFKNLTKRLNEIEA